MSLADRIDDIRLIRESAASLADRSDFGRVRALRFGSPGFDRSVYRSMAEMGWVGLTVPDRRGGLGLGMLEFCALSEELGAALAPEPLIVSAMTASLLECDALPDVISGRRIVLLAWQEAANTLDTTGHSHFRNGRVSGVKRFVPMAGGADAFLVTSSDGMALVSADCGAVRVDIHPTQDGGHYGTVHFDGAEGKPVAGDPRLALDACALATSAYLLGVIESALASTTEYLKTREQFGTAIGSFQVLQHRLVDLTLQAALTRASVEQAAVILDGGAGLSTAGAAISRAKVRASETALLVTRQSLQMHGGIGYTDEAEIGLFLRKAMVLAGSFGSARVHRDRYARLAIDSAL